MKKVIVLTLLILAFAATSYAQDQKLEFRVSGFIDQITEFWKNNWGTWGEDGLGGVINNGNSIYNVVPLGYQPFGPNGNGGPHGVGPINATQGFMSNTKESGWESRLRWKFDMVYGKELSGTVFFEADSTYAGDVAVASNNRLSDRNGFGYLSGDRAAVEIKNIYFDAAMPYMGIPVPMQLRVGLQTFAVRPALFVYSDMMAARGSFKFDPVNAEFWWGKQLEGRTWVADDDDIWGLHLNAKVDTFTVGAYTFYYNLDTYPLNKFTLNPGFDTSFKANFWFGGLYADGKAGPFDVNFDLLYDYGHVRVNGVNVNSAYYDPMTGGSVPDVKYSGWAGYVKADYPYDMFNFGVSAWYGSGADTEKTGPTGLPGGKTSLGTYNTKVSSFVNPPGSESGAVFGESLIMYSNWIDRGTGGWANNLNYNTVARGPIGGTWAAKVYGMYKVTPWYKITVNGLYIGDTTKNGNTFGTARKDPTDHSAFPALGYKSDSTIGWEMDLYNEFQIYKQLKWWVAGGYMWAGPATKFWDPYYETNRKLDNPWTIMTNLTYTF